ncbi:hypothetical protein DFH09DRAFT_1338843 [Mycena vulgaris]|nr:hypothetical protein DFH09DRAFT_1338843 [Mycena vulgaris]
MTPISIPSAKQPAMDLYATHAHAHEEKVPYPCHNTRLRRLPVPALNRLTSYSLAALLALNAYMHETVPRWTLYTLDSGPAPTPPCHAAPLPPHLTVHGSLPSISILTLHTPPIFGAPRLPDQIRPQAHLYTHRLRVSHASSRGGAGARVERAKAARRPSLPGPVHPERHGSQIPRTHGSIRAAPRLARVRPGTVPIRGRKARRSSACAP